LLDGCVAKAGRPSGHHAMPGRLDLLGDFRFVSHLEPDGVTEIGRTHVAIAFGLFAMAGYTVVGKELSAGFDKRWIVWCARQAHHIGGDLTNLLGLQHVGKCGHFRNTGIRVDAVSDTMSDRLIDGIDVAAPEPFVVVEVRIAIPAGGTRAVAGR